MVKVNRIRRTRLINHKTNIIYRYPFDEYDSYIFINILWPKQWNPLNLTWSNTEVDKEIFVPIYQNKVNKNIVFKKVDLSKISPVIWRIQFK